MSDTPDAFELPDVSDPDDTVDTSDDPDASDSHDPFASLLATAGIDEESLTYLVVAGGTRSSVGAALGAELGTVVGVDDVDFEEFSAYAFAEVDGGVVALEHSGYADPGTAALALMSAEGGAAGVVRDNIQGHVRLGCARDGVLVFDSDDYPFVEREEKAEVPAELLALFDTAWVDLDDEGDSEDDGTSGLLVGMAMVAAFTGVTVTVDDLRRATDAGYHRVRTGAYPG